MNSTTTIRHALAMALLLAATPVPLTVTAQTEDPDAAAEAPAESSVDAPVSREVDISEDNYRSYMELRDERLRRVALPTPQSPPATDLQKMEQLPEASQRHLRDQLREIIASRGPWTPEAVNTDYPFVPSAAARGDGELRQREAEAWNELIAGYHAREAEIQSSGGASGAPAQTDAGNDGAGAASARMAGGEGAASATEPAPATAPAGGGDQRMNQGVSQSALEFLTGARGGDGRGATDSGAAPGTGTKARDLVGESAPGGASSDSGEAADAETAMSGTATGAEGEMAKPAQSDSSRAAGRSARPDEGTSQSALEYLADETGRDEADSAAGEVSEVGAPSARARPDEGTSQSALEYLADESVRDEADRTVGEVSEVGAPSARARPDEGTSESALDYLEGEAGGDAGPVEGEADAASGTISLEELRGVRGIAPPPEAQEREDDEAGDAADEDGPRPR